MYPKTFAGLIACYVAGIPFYQHRVIGDMVFAVAFFAVPILLSVRAENGRGAATV
jgi:hypothetical protein